jgi:hypothetical protein
LGSRKTKSPLPEGRGLGVGALRSAFALAVRASPHGIGFAQGTQRKGGRREGAPDRFPRPPLPLLPKEGVGGWFLEVPRRREGV